MKTLDEIRQELAVTREILRQEARRSEEQVDRLLAECKSLRESLGDGHLFELAFAVVGRATVAASICAATLQEAVERLEK